MNRRNYLIPMLVIPILTWSIKAFAHGANIVYQQTQAIEITASYDQGEPMANAQVVVYAPSDPATPWLKGTTDEKGRFTFVPDPTQLGNWDIKVRQAGHGDLISIPIEGDQTLPNTTKAVNQSPYTPMQKILMAATGVWGFVGTGLFFASKTKR